MAQRRSMTCSPGFGPRLKRVRNQRDVTLTELVAAAGISKSTSSRLESGRRKPSSALLLPIAQAHRMPLDDLAGSPRIAEPRIHLEPEKPGDGRVVVPPYRFGAAGDEAVEILGHLSREGGRIHVPARPRRKPAEG